MPDPTPTANTIKREPKRFLLVGEDAPVMQEMLEATVHSAVCEKALSFSDIPRDKVFDVIVFGRSEDRSGNDFLKRAKTMSRMTMYQDTKFIVTKYEPQASFAFEEKLKPVNAKILSFSWHNGSSYLHLAQEISRIFDGALINPQQTVMTVLSRGAAVGSTERS